jgi:hypothetical protein
MLLLALVAAGCALSVAACGGSSTGTSSSPYGPKSSPVALSKCMRANGLSNFPDPSAGPGSEGFNGILTSVGGHSLIVDGITFAGPALETAQKACA